MWRDDCEYEGGTTTQPKVLFVVTGFGPFHDVPTNPTNVILDQLVDFLKDRESASDKPSTAVKLSSAILQTRVLEVSTEAVSNELDQIHSEILKQYPSEDPTTTGHPTKLKAIVVLVHLGVDATSNSFSLERCAYNEMNFRVPDERGYQPKEQCIQDDFPLGSALETRLCLSELALRLKEWPLEETTDPGRFVCNYTYYYSLCKFCSSSLEEKKNIKERGGENHGGSSSSAPVENHHGAAAVRFQSLFVHVPPFDVVPESHQLECIAQILEAIYHQVLRSSGGGELLKEY